MKKFFLGFNQRIVVEHGLDFKDLIILRFVMDGIERRIFIKKVMDKEVYYWIKMQGILDSYPVMNIKSKAVIRRKMKNLVDMGFLKYKLDCQNGRYTLYSLTKLGWDLCKKSEVMEVKKAESIKGEEKNEEEKMAETIINYLNEVIGSRYKANGSGTIKYIKKLVTDGFTLEDFKEVIDSKNREWKNTKYEKYLRPSTLFRRQNFEEYLNIACKKEECDFAAYDEY